MYEPNISPDGREIAFVSGGQIWTVPTEGGLAHLLVGDSSMSFRPIYSPDGNAIAFTSTRTGNGDIYTLALRNNSLRRLTWDDAPDYLSGWSRDGKWLYFYSSSREVPNPKLLWNDIWRVGVEGGTPMQVVAERYLNEYHGAPSPDGKSLAFVARGYASLQWWRHGSSHIDHSQIWVLDLESGKYSPLTQDVSREVWPMWSSDSKVVYFVSDKESGENIWSVRRNQTPIRISDFKNERVLWPSISSDAKTIVFERDLGIWNFDIQSRKASRLDIQLHGVSGIAAPDHQKLTDFSEMAIAPDGKKLAVVARGDIFVASTKQAGEALRVTRTPDIESQPVWSPDSRALAYVSRRAGSPHLYEWNSSTFSERQLTCEPSAIDNSPLYSPDSKLIAFVRNGRELMIIDREMQRSGVVSASLFDGPPITGGQPLAWSPDSRWIAFIGVGDDYLHNVYVVGVSGGRPVQLSFLPNATQETNSIHWADGGRQVLFVTKQRTEIGHIARFTFAKDSQQFAEDRLRGLFQDERPRGRVENIQNLLTLDLRGIRDRTRLAPLGLDIQELTISPDGKWLAFSAQVPANNDPGNQRVYAIAADAAFTDGGQRPIVLASTSGSKAFLAFSTDSQEVFFLDGTRIAAASIDPPKLRTVDVSCEMDVDVAQDNMTLLNDASSILRENYYDPNMHGADWDGLVKHFRGLIESARSRDETRRILNLMIGELNSSHSGVYLFPKQASTGRIGVRFDREEYETQRQLKVSEVIPNSPADIAGIHVGDVIEAVNGRPVINFDQSFENMVDKRVTVTIKGSPEHELLVRPVNAKAEQDLVYRAWVTRNGDLVDKLSKGRLGYVHLFDMLEPSLNRFYLDLDTETRRKKGVVVDLRNNNGGFVDPYTIDVLSRTPYLYFTQRGFPPSSERTVAGQRALEKPTILVVNRHSLSDAELFAEGYRTLKLGKTVGEPTAGWAIATFDLNLIDGTALRVPNMKVSDRHGKDLELNPRPVDLAVQSQIGESQDSQVSAAVSELLGDLP